MLARVSRAIVAFGLSAALIALTPGGAGDGPILGFSEAGSEAQRQLEARFDSNLSADSLRAWMRQMTRKPRHVGAPYTREMAQFILGRFESWGFDAAIEEFQVLFPTPKVRRLELLGPEPYVARLEEPAIAEDETSSVREDMLPLYNAYSADGDVTGELVYVNYGIPEDYEELGRRGISVEGKIVIARYGGSWRGIKPKVAAEHGAIACILFSDPRDDGYHQGDVYPGGAYRSELGGQRGSVSDMPTYPGDPLTPGVGAKRDTKRMSVEESPTIMKIPVLPIGYADALPFMQALAGPVAPAGWRGALPITYHIGPGPAKVHLRLEFNWDLAPAYNVIARLHGSEFPDEWVIRGNHFDGWVFGARDPISGMVVVMEEARALGELVKQGWRPKRTIVYAAWDAEEPGLLGSTEWAEYHAAELKDKAAIYINSDSNTRGFLRVGGSHTLEKFINQIAREVTDPQTAVSVWERAQARSRVGGDAEAGTRADLRINALGSGSDYTPFLQHLGIASMDIRFTGEGGGGSYHSIYDSFDHYTRFGDPTFQYGVALASTAGRAVLRFANAEVLPYQFTNFADNVARYVTEVIELAEEMREKTELENGLINDGAYLLAADPTETFIVPKPKAPVPFINFAPLQNAFARLEASAKSYDERLSDGGLDALSKRGQESLNRILMQTERALTSEAGLPRRPWFKHQVYAPGYYTGYGVKTLPGVREAIEQRDWDEVADQIVITAKTLERFADSIDRATAVLSDA